MRLFSVDAGNNQKSYVVAPDIKTALETAVAAHGPFIQSVIEIPAQRVIIAPDVP